MSESGPQGGDNKPEPQEPSPGADKPRASEQGALEEAAETQKRGLGENIPGRKGDEPPQETADRLEEQKYVPVPKRPDEKLPEKPFRGRGQKDRPRRKKKKPESG